MAYAGVEIVEVPSDAESDQGKGDFVVELHANPFIEDESEIKVKKIIMKSV